MSISPAELAYQLAHIDENLGPTTIGSCAMLLVIASAAVGFRLYAKTLTSSGFGSDDYLIMAALVRSIPLNVVSTPLLTEAYAAGLLHC